MLVLEAAEAFLLHQLPAAVRVSAPVLVLLNIRNMEAWLLASFLLRQPGHLHRMPQNQRLANLGYLAHV